MSYFDTRQTLPPENYARMVLQQQKSVSFPLNVTEIIQNQGIYYFETDFNNVQKIVGRLESRNGKKLITINKNIPYQARKTFTAAHELGHATIPDHNLPVYQCSNRSVELYNTEWTYENEANRFATELLMPEPNVKELIKRADFSYQTISMVSETFGTSLISAALRVIEFTIDPCAIVVSENNQILWSRKTRQFHYEIHPKGKKLSPNSYAADFFSGQELKDAFDLVDPKGWLSDARIPDSLELWEHAICFPNLGTVLSLLKIKTDDDEEMIDE